MKFSTSILAIVCTLAATAFAAPSSGQDVNAPKENPIEARQACPSYDCNTDTDCSSILCGGCGPNKKCGHSG